MIGDMNRICIGLIGGSGLGEALATEKGETVFVDTPFGPPSSPILSTRRHGVDLAILQRHGPGHVLNPSHVPYRANVFALKKLGVTHIIASGASGSLREEIRPGDLVVIDQLIDKTFRRPNTFFEHAAVHVEFADPFCPVTRRWLLDAASKLPSIHVHPAGTYICMEGPAFSTRAESKLHRLWGGDLIGMTACPEAKLAREAEIAYALIALPTDYDCWRPHQADTPPHELLRQILANLSSATSRCIELIQTALADVSILADNPSPAHDALRLAIWSEKTKIPRMEIERLKPLWGEYFEEPTS
jgi:5'-methylthioadenosine phosphorylase